MRRGVDEGLADLARIARRAQHGATRALVTQRDRPTKRLWPNREARGATSAR